MIYNILDAFRSYNASMGSLGAVIAQKAMEPQFVFCEGQTGGELYSFGSKSPDMRRSCSK